MTRRRVSLALLVVLGGALLLEWQGAPAATRATVARSQVVRLSVDGWGGATKASAGGARVSVLGVGASGVESVAPGGARVRVHRLDAVPRPAPPDSLTGFIAY